MGPVSSKNSSRKRVFYDGRNFAPWNFCPQSFHLVRLTKKIGEVRFSTKIQTENMFFGKTNSRGLLGLNLPKFSSVTILPPTALIACLASEIGMGPVSSKNSDRKRVFWDGRNFPPGHFCPHSCHRVRLAKKIGEVRFSTKIQSENMIFGKMNSIGLLRWNWAKFLSGTILPPNASCSQLGPEKMYEAGFIKKFQTKTCFLGWTKLRSGTLLPPITQSSPFGQENRWGAI